LKLLVVGTRTFNDYNILSEELNKYYNIEEIITGITGNTDSMAVQYANEKSIKWKRYVIEKDSLGRTIGYNRNKDMIESSDEIIIFWDGKSCGTKDLIEKAESMKRRYNLIKL